MFLLKFSHVLYARINGTSLSPSPKNSEEKNGYIKMCAVDKFLRGIKKYKSEVSNEIISFMICFL